MKYINYFKPCLKKQYLETIGRDFCIFFNSEGISFAEILTPIVEVSLAQFFFHLQLRRHLLCGGLIISFTEVFLISNCGGISFAEVVLTPIAGASPLRRFLSSPIAGVSPLRSFFSSPIAGASPLRRFLSSPIAGVSPLRSFFSSPIAGASPLQSFNHLLYGGISHHQLQSILICRNYSNLQLRRFSHLLCGGFRYLSHQKLCNYKELSMYTFFLYAFISVC